MRLKVCSICKSEKSFKEFNKNVRKPDGLQTICKDCNRQKSKNYYAENREKHLKVISERKAKQIKLAQQFVFEYLQNHSCVDCSEADPVVLDFDHTGDKIDNIANLITHGYCVETIQKEIAKCEVRCANCHRRKTAKDFNHYRYRMLHEN